MTDLVCESACRGKGSADLACGTIAIEGTKLTAVGFTLPFVELDTDVFKGSITIAEGGAAFFTESEGAISPTNPDGGTAKPFAEIAAWAAIFGWILLGGRITGTYTCGHADGVGDADM
jgi:hypothetical protein